MNSIYNKACKNNLTDPWSLQEECFTVFRNIDIGLQESREQNCTCNSNCSIKWDSLSIQKAAVCEKSEKQDGSECAYGNGGLPQKKC